MHNKYYYAIIFFMLQLGIMTISASPDQKAAAFTKSIKTPPSTYTMTKDEISDIIDESLMEQQSYIDNMVRRELSVYKSEIEEQRNEKARLKKVSFIQSIIIVIESIISIFVIKHVADTSN